MDMRLIEVTDFKSKVRFDLWDNLESNIGKLSLQVMRGSPLVNDETTNLAILAGYTKRGIKHRGFSTWGIQTKLESLYHIGSSPFWLLQNRDVMIPFFAGIGIGIGIIAILNIRYRNRFQSQNHNISIAERVPLHCIRLNTWRFLKSGHYWFGLSLYEYVYDIHVQPWGTTYYKIEPRRHPGYGHEHLRILLIKGVPAAQSKS